MQALNKSSAINWLDLLEDSSSSTSWLTSAPFPVSSVIHSATSKRLIKFTEKGGFGVAIVGGCLGGRKNNILGTHVQKLQEFITLFWSQLAE